MIPPAKLQKHLEEGTVQIAPLAYRRGRTLDNAVVILDEAQNTTHARQEHLDLRQGSVLRLVQNDEGVVQRAAAHVGQRGDLQDVYKRQTQTLTPVDL